MKSTTAGVGLPVSGDIEPSVEEQKLQEKKEKLRWHEEAGNERRKVRVKVTMNAPCKVVYT